ncbi:MAG: hypothetical protein P4M09_26640 [Devosia sp.]|nr:hypothetical protein [Devosia sp.]
MSLTFAPGPGPVRPGHLTAELPVRTCLLILGMHRSGTSALAGTLAHLGCRMPKTLIGPNDSNEAGHWESMMIAALDDDILRATGRDWRDWWPLDPATSKQQAGSRLRQRARLSIQDEFGAAQLFVLKEPRMCRIADFWLATLAESRIDVVAVLPMRDPLEVAASLARRDGIPRTAGLFIWLRYVLDAERATRRLKRSFTSYDGLLADWRKTIGALEKTHQLAWPTPLEAAAPEIDAFLDQRHRHQVESLHATSDGGAILDWVRNAYAIFERWIAAGEDPADFAALDQIRSAFDSTSPTLKAILASRLESLRPTDLLTATSEQLSAAKVEFARPRVSKAPPKPTDRQDAQRPAAARRAASERLPADAPLSDIDASLKLQRALNAVFTALDNPWVPAGLRTRLLSRMLQRSGLFDAAWYASQYADVAQADVDPLAHYVTHGLAEGRKFNRLLLSELGL